MDLILDGLLKAFNLLFFLDREVFAIILLSLEKVFKVKTRIQSS